MNNDVRIEESWKMALQEQFESAYFTGLSAFVKSEYQTKKVYPPPELIFNAFDRCPFERVKVVIIGQDPYHGAGQAQGLCFSVPDGVRVPPSLVNIYKELHDDIGKEIPVTGNLAHWADQGVLLLNATLTVRAGEAGSHHGKGWEQFTDAVITQLSARREHLVFMLWGNYARNKKVLIDVDTHLVLEAPHSSPFSAYTGFLGCKHFSKANAYLREHAIEGVMW